MTLGEMLERSAERYPDKTAIVFKDRRVKYKDLNAEANKLGRALNAMSIGKDDKVGILMPNCPEFVVAVFGALKAGAVFVALNALLQGRELTYVINNSDAKIIIAAPPYDELLVMLRPQLPQVKQIITLDDDHEEEDLVPFSSLIEPYEDTNLKPKVKLDDVAAIYYSSGTTGLPKGAMLSHVNILSSTVAIGKAVNASRKDVPLTCIPMFHTLAMTACIMVPIFGGMTNVLLENFLPQPVLQNFSDWKVTIFVGVPTMFAVLANMPNLDRFDVSHLRLGYCGGAPLTTAIAEKFESKFPCKIYEGYGLSECSPLVSVNPLGNRKIGSIGKAADRVSWKIADKNGKELPRGTVGEIIVSGPNVMKGYYKDEEATRQAIRGEDVIIFTEQALKRLKNSKYDPLPEEIAGKLTSLTNKKFPNENVFLNALGKQLGKQALDKYKDIILKETRNRWFYTGDLGYMDEDGFVYIADRKKDMIIVGGENVYPKEVENVLTQYPGIQDAGVIGIEDPIRGEVPKAYIVPKLGASIDEKDVLAFCRKHLAQFKIPRSIEIIDEIPKNVTGKILKRVLRRIAAGLPADEDEEEFEEDLEEEEVLEVDEAEVESAEDTAAEAPPEEGMGLEDRLRQMEAGAMAPPPESGVSLEDQMRQLESQAAAPPPSIQQPEVAEEAAEIDQEPAEFEDHLRNLVMDIPGGLAGSIAGIDGIAITSFSNDPDFPTTIAVAELAAVLGTFKKATDSLSAGNPKEAFFVSDNYGFIIKVFGDQYFVTLIIQASELNWGLTRLQLDKVLPRIERELP
ncbi:AMP-binding protein [candidate division KSB3 bacterium]|uniref:AMP-binding protein n=1 Tax=candidate division KSB3 bacterium TaxID=2044937 RepID=A0A9D5Q689_9BACT|nr:AMP-binding protein [candidate division KSB3 bacterium]MBD3325470.1 AMP-binding protein [candidate division KSB3 bacterium]